MKILFITSNRLGDAVLSTGILAHILREHPAARVTVACGNLPKSIFEGYPSLERLIPFSKEKYNMHWVRLWTQVMSTRWDMVIDLRDSAVSRLVIAKTRFIYGGHIDQMRHKVEQTAQVMGLSSVPSPALWFTEAQQVKACQLVPDGDAVLAVGPTANWVGKTWPADRFIELIRALTSPGGIMPGARVAVFAAPGEEEQAKPVFESIPESRRIDVIAKGTPGEAAAALARCAFYVGNDSGLMHSAAATGIPTVGLFGPSWPHLYGPWGAHTFYVSTPENFDQLTDYAGYSPKTSGCLMTTLTLEAVVSGINEWYAKQGQGIRQSA